MHQSLSMQESTSNYHFPSDWSNIAQHMYCCILISFKNALARVNGRQLWMDDASTTQTVWSSWDEHRTPHHKEWLWLWLFRYMFSGCFLHGFICGCPRQNSPSLCPCPPWISCIIHVMKSWHFTCVATSMGQTNPISSHHRKQLAHIGHTLIDPHELPCQLGIQGQPTWCYIGINHMIIS